MIYYVYQLVDPRTNIPFYIGKGTADRMNDHFNENESNTANMHKYKRIQFLESVRTPARAEIIKDNFTSEQNAYDFEEKLIKFYGRIGYDESGCLTNVCKDNRPPNHKGRSKTKEHINKIAASNCGKIRSRKIRDEMSKRMKGKYKGNNNPFYGKTHTKETKQCQSMFMTGRFVGAKNPNAKTYKIISPKGKEYVIHGGLIKFCKEYDLSSSTMEKCLKTKIFPKSGRAANWKIYKIQKETQ